MSDKKYEKDDAEKAEKHDEEEDRDYKRAKETGRSEKGYERDDAEKAEAEDDEEDADYDRSEGDDEEADVEDDKASHDEAQADDGGGDNEWEDERKEALRLMDERYALRKEHEDLKSRMTALEQQLGALNNRNPESVAPHVVSLDDDINDQFGGK